jgi:hypothetical protein
MTGHDNKSKPEHDARLYSMCNIEQTGGRRGEQIRRQI